MTKPSGDQRKVTSDTITLTQAEKDEIRKKIMIKAQKSIFLKYFPELHEKG